MNYYNWQKIHKEVLSIRRQIITTPLPTLAVYSDLPLSDHQLRAWHQLTQSCTPKQLENLWRLAEQYQADQHPA